MRSRSSCSVSGARRSARAAEPDHRLTEGPVGATEGWCPRREVRARREGDGARALAHDDEIAGELELVELGGQRRRGAAGEQGLERVPEHPLSERAEGRRSIEPQRRLGEARIRWPRGQRLETQRRRLGGREQEFVEQEGEIGRLSLARPAVPVCGTGARARSVERRRSHAAPERADEPSGGVVRHEAPRLQQRIERGDRASRFERGPRPLEVRRHGLGHRSWLLPVPRGGNSVWARRVSDLSTDFAPEAERIRGQGRQCW